MKRALYAALIVLYLLHNDLWAWNDGRFVLGMPVGLLYHVVYSVVAAGLLVELFALSRGVARRLLLALNGRTPRTLRLPIRLALVTVSLRRGLLPFAMVSGSLPRRAWRTGWSWRAIAFSRFLVGLSAPVS